MGNFSCRYSEELKLLKTLDFSQRLEPKAHPPLEEIRLWRKSRVETLFTNETLMATSRHRKEMKIESLVAPSPLAG